MRKREKETCSKFSSSSFSGFSSLSQVPILLSECIRRWILKVQEVSLGSSDSVDVLVTTLVTCILMLLRFLQHEDQCPRPAQATQNFHLSTFQLPLWARGWGFGEVYRPTCCAAITLSLQVLSGQRRTWALRISVYQSIGCYATLCNVPVPLSCCSLVAFKPPLWHLNLTSFIDSLQLVQVLRQAVRGRGRNVLVLHQSLLSRRCDWPSSNSWISVILVVACHLLTPSCHWLVSPGLQLIPAHLMCPIGSAQDPFQLFLACLTCLISPARHSSSLARPTSFSSHFTDSYTCSLLKKVHWPSSHSLYVLQGY